MDCVPNAQRIVIVGGPRRGKSTLAERYRSAGIPVFCGDPRSTVKDPIDGVTYLPEGLPFAGDGGGGHYVATHWLAMPGPWVAEGHVMARALRRWLAGSDRDEPPCEQIVVLQDAKVDTTPGQEAMHRNVMTVWAEIADWFASITHYTDAAALPGRGMVSREKRGRPGCGLMKHPDRAYAAARPGRPRGPSRVSRRDAGSLSVMEVGAMPKEKINHAPTMIQCDPATGDAANGVLPAIIGEVAWTPVPNGEAPGAWADGVTRRDAEVCVGWQRDGWVQLSIEAEPDYFRMAAQYVDSGDERTSVYTPPLTRDQINKLIRTLRRAREQAFGRDE